MIYYSVNPTVGPTYVYGYVPFPRFCLTDQLGESDLLSSRASVEPEGLEMAFAYLRHSYVYCVGHMVNLLLVLRAFLNAIDMVELLPHTDTGHV